MSHDPQGETYETPLGLQVRRLQPAIGAEISGVDLRTGVTPALIAELRAALLAHGVIFLRRQDITYEQHVALGEAFGDLIREGADPARPEVTVVTASAGATDQSASQWHSDGTYMAVPPSISILRGIQVRPFGGDTCFSSATAAYQGLSEEMKTRIADLRYVADMKRAMMRDGKPKLAFASEARWREVQEKYPAVEQPVVRVHPETGQPLLYVNEAHSVEIVGMEEAEGRALIRTLNEEFKRPEYQVRWSWENHSIAIWDNRAVQHYGVPDQQYDRYLERVTIRGTRPFGLREWETAQERQPAPA